MTIADAVERGDLDELTRLVDRLCAARDWDGVVELRDRCRRALERGRQLWPVASHCEYRLALEAPGPIAATVLVEDAGHLTVGPLAEVAASTHTWDELAPHVVPGPVAGLCAHERVVRGDDLAGRDVPYADVLAVPLRLQPWEPEYETATYRAGGAEFPAPDPPRGRPAALPDPGGLQPVVDDAARALLDVVRPWTSESEGRAAAVAVEGTAEAAIAALGAREARTAPLSGAEALAWLGWAGASGGRRGRRRGAARGRDAAWAALAALGGLTAGEDPSAHADDLGAVAQGFRWLWWTAADAPWGWVLRLAVEDRNGGIAWAIDARDPAAA